MATDRLINETQGASIITQLTAIASAITGITTERLHFDWSYTQLPSSGRTDTIYCIPTGDTGDPWDFYVWNDNESEFVKIDFTYDVDSALSDSSENPVQNKVVKAALDTKANSSALGTAAAKDYNNTYSPTSEDVATGKTIADAFDYFGFSIVNGKLCQTYTTT